MMSGGAYILPPLAVLLPPQFSFFAQRSFSPACIRSVSLLILGGGRLGWIGRLAC